MRIELIMAKKINKAQLVATCFWGKVRRIKAFIIIRHKALTSEEIECLIDKDMLV